MKEFELIEKKDLREKFVDRIEVLEKVKGLLLLPDINMATTQQVADYYEVDVNVIKMQVSLNRDEIMADGVKNLSGKETKEVLASKNILPTNFRGYFEACDQRFSHRNNLLFPRRAILRVGMLLRDSEVAKEVRTQLLNIEEKTTEQQKISSITEEQQLMLDVMYATNDSDRLLAFSKFNDYKNRYINSLENKIEALTDGILRWDSREGVNRMVRKIAVKAFNNSFSSAWDKVYAEMLYKHNIGITARKTNCKTKKKPTIFDVLNGEEQRLLVKSCLSLCEMYGVDIDDLLIKVS